MSAKDCFEGKIGKGIVARAAGERVKALVRAAEERAKAGDGVGARAAMEEAQQRAAFEAAQKEALASGRILAQKRILDQGAVYGSEMAARQAQGTAAPELAASLLHMPKTPVGGLAASLMARDAHDIADWANVDTLSVALRGEAAAGFVDGIEHLRPKDFGWTPQIERENDVLDALFGGGTAEGRGVAQAWGAVAEKLRGAFNKAAGFEAIPERQDWRLPNPMMATEKVQAWSRQDFSRKVEAWLDRGKMIDFETGKPLDDARLEEVLADVYETARTDGAEGPPTDAYVGEGPLAARRSHQRTLIFKGPQEWRAFNETFGSGVGVFDTMMRHIASMTHAEAVMRVFGPDPEASRRFILSLFDREGAFLAHVGKGDAASQIAAVKSNRAIADDVSTGREHFETLWSHMTGEAVIPVNVALARMASDARAALSAGQLGTALLSSLSDMATLASTARFNDLPATATMGRALRMLADGEAEITAAQAGLIADSLTHGAGSVDRYMGETLRASTAAKLATVVNRASGLRRWTSVLRSAFGLEFMAQMANHIGRNTPYSDLPFRASLARYGVGESQWRNIAQTARAQGLWEPSPGAVFLRPLDLKRAGMAQEGDSLARMIAQEMNFATIEGDAVTRAIIYGRTKPGTLKGEAWRSALQYKLFPLTVAFMHGSRGFARGWDGSRMAHAGFTMMMMTLFGMVSFQAKQLAAGRDLVDADPRSETGRRAWLNAFLQGGGAGPLADIFFQDKTKFGNRWSAFLGGPLLTAAEDIGGQWAIKNIELGLQGKETHFLGDALWIGARYIPGSSLWYAKAALQRAVLDQAQLAADDRAQERFARIEQRAREDFHQGYWWRRGRIKPERLPAAGSGR